MRFTGPASGDGLDVLRAQHQTIRTLVQAVQDDASGGRQDCLDLLCGSLAAHEAAESSLLRPVTRTCVVGGDVVADARSVEEGRARVALDEALIFDVGTAEFRAAFGRFSRGLLEHLDNEEHYEFPLVRAYRDEDALQAMGTVLRRSDGGVPTSQSVPTAIAEAMISPLMSAVGKVRDALTVARPA